MMFDEYQDRVGELITGIVQQSDSRYTLVQLRERVEALLPRSEQVPGERYDHGARVKAIITDVSSQAKGPSIIVSRRSPELIRALFELEVPEIADGLVEIQNVAREPGYRSKIAVVSHANGVDPVGACVGPRGSRVRMVVSELRGEKIDIIPFNEEPARFVAKALSPARVREVLVDDEAKQATVIVPDDQLSLAIGKDGLNARLAARLTGWRVDIRSETEFANEEDELGLEEEEIAGRCAAILSNGKRCPNAAISGSRYCGLPAHQALSDTTTTTSPASRRPPTWSRRLRWMAKKRVHEIAKEKGIPSKEVIAKLQAAGLNVKAAASSVDEADIEAAFAGRKIESADGRGKGRSGRPSGTARPGNGKPAASAVKPAPAATPPAQPRPALPHRVARRRPHARRVRRATAAAPAAAASRRRVVIDSQASRRAPGPPPQQQQPPRRRGRRRRTPWVEPDFSQVEEKPQEDVVTEIKSGATVKEVSESLGLSAPDVIKKLMELGEMATLTQTLSDEAIEVLADGFDKKIEIVRAADEAAEEIEFEDADEELSSVRRSSPSWATSTTARRRCSTRSARPRSPPARPAASPSTSAPTRSTTATTRSPSSTPRATRPSPRCAPAARASPTSR